uniref:ENGC_GTPASE domain-containing protein n=1 Tax=Macrostomum lignano TaxID=282301 RepID=A0A1I8JR30_9PLAT
MVGKSSLVRHFVEDGAPQQLSCEPTVGVDFFSLAPSNCLTAAGEADPEKFRSITPGPTIANAVAALIVFDVGCRASFEAVPAWHAEARRCMASEHACCLLVGQKADLPPALRRVGADEAAYMAAQLGVPYMETSAVSGLNIDATFCHLAQLVYSQFAAGSYDGKLGRGRRRCRERKRRRLGRDSNRHSRPAAMTKTGTGSARKWQRRQLREGIAQDEAEIRRYSRLLKLNKRRKSQARLPKVFKDTGLDYLLDIVGGDSDKDDGDDNDLRDKNPFDEARVAEIVRECPESAEYYSQLRAASEAAKTKQQMKKTKKAKRRPDQFCWSRSRRGQCRTKGRGAGGRAGAKEADLYGRDLATSGVKPSTSAEQLVD